MADDDTPQPLLPAFTPVPRAKDRSNGWKPEVQRRFIEALAETGSVKAACRRIGRSSVGAYQLRRHPEAHEFRAAWDAALDLGMRRLEDDAMDRALYGVEETYFYHGELRGRRRRFNERLVMFMLRNRLPERFAQGGGARGLNAVDRQALARLKKQWRNEWELECQLLAQERGQDVLDSIDRMIDDMRERRRANEAVIAETRFDDEPADDAPAALPAPPETDDPAPPEGE